MTRGDLGSKPSSQVEMGEAENRRPVHVAQLETLKRDVAAGVRSILEGRVSHASPREIKAKALRRRAIK